jgi:hypothetical protein
MSAENSALFGLIYISVYLVIETISLVGIIIENQWIVITFFVLSILGVMCFVAIYLVIQIIGLVGIIKENQRVVIMFFVLPILGVIGNCYNYGIGYGLIGLGVTNLTGIYAYKIVKYEKQYV